MCVTLYCTQEEALLLETCWPIVAYLHMANVPVQCTQWMNAFNTTRGDKMVMRPFAYLDTRYYVQQIA